MNDAEYLSLRAQQELVAAMKARDRRVRDIHLELADAYSFRLRETQALTSSVRYVARGARSAREA